MKRPLLPLTYAPHPTRGTVHLVPDHDPNRPVRTLCGLLVTPAWSLGDETMHGAQADCGACLRFRGSARVAGAR